jgi:hypothetical protein
MPLDGRPQTELTKRVLDLDLDTEHFRGTAWSRGETASSNASVARTTKRITYADDIVFSERSPIVNGPRLVRRLLAMGWTYECAWCGLSEWRGERLVLHLDHINGINNDNRIINLRLLCPNCHSQTATYCNRRR